MTDIDITDLLERITGCINNAEYDDEADTLSDAFTVIEAQAAEIDRLRAVVDSLIDRIVGIAALTPPATIILDPTTLAVKAA